MKKPTTSPPTELPARISRIRVHQRTIVLTDGPRITADAADSRGTAEPQMNIGGRRG